MLFTPVGSHFPYLDVYSIHGDRMIKCISLLQYLLVSVLLGIWMNRRARGSDRSKKHGVEQNI